MRELIIRVPFQVSKPVSTNLEAQSAKPTSEKAESSLSVPAKEQKLSKTPKKPSSLKENVSGRTGDGFQGSKATSAVDTKATSTKVISTAKSGPLKNKGNVDTVGNPQPVVSPPCGPPIEPPSEKGQCVCVHIHV